MLSQNFIEEMKQQLLAAKQKLQTELGGLSAHEELGSDLIPAPRKWKTTKLAKT